MILANAAHFFATNGFSAPLRDLARNISVSPSLILRYFGTREELVRRVYDHVVWRRWNLEWSDVLHDRNVSLRERLKTFYRWFLEISDDYDYVRCGVYSGLEGEDVAKTHFEATIEKYLKVIAIELRAESGDTSTRAVSPHELEQVWVLHSPFVHFLTRKHVHHRSALPGHEELVDVVVDTFLDSATPRETNGSDDPSTKGSKRARATAPPAGKAPKRRSERPIAH